MTARLVPAAAHPARDKVLRSIASITAAGQGRPPTRREIAAEAGLSPGSIAYYALLLHVAGLLTNRGGTRGMQVTDAGHRYLRGSVGGRL